MRLEFKKQHLSIEQFSPVELPEFVVLTGVNGSGKSHLLEAIANRSVTIVGYEQSNIVLFDYQNFRMENEPPFNAQQLAKEREDAWQLYESQIKNNVQTWKSGLIPDYEQVKAVCKKERRGILSRGLETLSQYRQHVTNYFLAPRFRENYQMQGIYSLAKKLPFSIDEITREEFDLKFRPYVLKNNFLPHQLGKVFWDYYVKYQGNEIREFQNEKHGKNHAVLTQEEFVAEHGPKPWDVINEILRQFDTLHYVINSPEGADVFGNFQVKLKHTDNPKLEVEFSSLSSGEKVLMALVASIYKASSDGNFPDILLLDEVDASLHPSMMRNMLGVIHDIFLKQGMKVILVTHSPTTIALAPEDSVFVMNRSGLNRIEKRPKQDALGILTQGFATLEQGLSIFDQVAHANFTIITEGNNSTFIEQMLRHYGVEGVSVLAGVEGKSGKNQLKTLFDFFCRTDHQNQVLFVWDGDVEFKLQHTKNTFPFIFPKNVRNQIAKKGVENLFHPELFEGFTKRIEMSNGEVIYEFDDTRKKDFEKFIVRRNNSSDYKNFESLVAEISRIKALMQKAA